MDDDVLSDVRQREQLRLVKAFLGITDPRKRQKILKLAEQLADKAGSDAADVVVTSATPSFVETPGDSPGQVD